MQKKIIEILSLILLTQSSYAMFCPNSFNQIQIGDTIETVLQQCGKPDEEKTTKQKAEDTSPQEWGYYVQQSPRNPTSMKLSVVFSGGKAINISVNGAGISTTDLCGHPIKTDDTMEMVKAACGSPMFVNKGQEAEGKQTIPTADEITEYKYNSTPPAKLIFKNGKLDSREQ